MRYAPRTVEKYSPAQAIANRLMLRIIRNSVGVDGAALQCMVETKNASVSELDRKPDEALVVPGVET